MRTYDRSYVLTEVHICVLRLDSSALPCYSVSPSVSPFCCFVFFVPFLVFCQVRHEAWAVFLEKHSFVVPRRYTTTETQNTPKHQNLEDGSKTVSAAWVGTKEAEVEIAVFTFRFFPECFGDVLAISFGFCGIPILILFLQFKRGLFYLHELKFYISFMLSVSLLISQCVGCNGTYFNK